jgi:hypothetical protein
MTQDELMRRLEALVAQAKRDAHREGYELARKEAAQIRCHLRAYDVVMAERVV